MISHDYRVSFLLRRCLVFRGLIGFCWLVLATSSPAQPGSIDSTFHIGSGPDNPVVTVKSQSDGKVLVGGVFAVFNGFERHGLARLNPTGSVDTAFVPVLTDPAEVDAILPLANGQVLIGGAFSIGAVHNLARLNSNGTLDATFLIGSGADDQVLALALQADGKILVGGNFSSFNETPRNRIARLNTNGTVDMSFYSTNGPDFGVNAVAVQTDGKAIIGGIFSSVDGVSRNHIARLNSNGILDPTFDPGFGTDYNVFDVIVQPDGQMLLAGAFQTVHSTPANAVARLNPDGSPDGSFNSAISPGESVNSIALQLDGKVIAVGDIGLAVRLNRDGSVDSGFDLGREPDDDVRAVELQNDGDVLIGGLFASVNNVSERHLARLNGNVPLLNIVKTGPTFTVSVPTGFGKTYTLQSQNFIGATWTNVPLAMINGNGTTRQLQDTNATTVQRFYRVLVTE